MTGDQSFTPCHDYDYELSLRLGTLYILKRRNSEVCTTPVSSGWFSEKEHTAVINQSLEQQNCETLLFWGSPKPNSETCVFLICNSNDWKKICRKQPMAVYHCVNFKRHLQHEQTKSKPFLWHVFEESVLARGAFTLLSWSVKGYVKNRMVDWITIFYDPRNIAMVFHHQSLLFLLKFGG